MKRRARKKLKIKIPEYLRQAVEFYGSFNEDFLKQINDTAKLTKTNTATVIQQLLTVYMAQDFAIYSTMGKTKTFQRAFQFTPEGLISGNQLSEQVAAEVTKAAEDLRSRLEAMKHGKMKETIISFEEAGLMSARL